MDALELTACILAALWVTESLAFLIGYSAHRRSAGGSAPSPKQQSESQRP